MCSVNDDSTIKLKDSVYIHYFKARVLLTEKRYIYRSAVIGFDVLNNCSKLM